MDVTRTTHFYRPAAHEHRFVNALIQWKYRDPTIELLTE